MITINSKCKMCFINFNQEKSEGQRMVKLFCDNCRRIRKNYVQNGVSIPETREHDKSVFFSWDETSMTI